MLKELLDEIRTTDIPESATLKAWVNSIKLTFVTYLDCEDNWDKIQDFLLQITKPEPREVCCPLASDLPILQSH